MLTLPGEFEAVLVLMPKDGLLRISRFIPEPLSVSHSPLKDMQVHRPLLNPWDGVSFCSLEFKKGNRVLSRQELTQLACRMIWFEGQLRNQALGWCLGARTSGGVATILRTNKSGSLCLNCLHKPYGVF